MDIESAWTGIQDAYHLIFARMLHGAIRDWSAVYRRISSRLASGGWFEQAEMNFTPCCDDDTFPPDSALRGLIGEVTSTMRAPGGHFLSNLLEIQMHMEAAGLVDYYEEVIPVAFNGWPADAHERQIGAVV